MPKRKLEQLEQRLKKQQEAFARIPNDHDVQSDPKYTYPLICELAASSLHVDRASVWLLDSEGEELRCRNLYTSATGSHQSVGTIPPVKAPSYFKLLEQADSLEICNATADERIHELAELYLKPAGIKSALHAAIVCGGHMVGAIFLEDTSDRREWETDEIVFIERLRDKTAALISNWELVKSNRMLQLVVDTIPVRVFWKDTDLNYLGCNKSFAEDAGRESPDHVIGDNDYNMGWRDQADLYRSDDQQVLDGGKQKIDIVEPQTTPDGNQLWLRTSKVPIWDEDNEVVGVLGTYQDITEQRELEERLRQSQKMDSIGQLAGGVAHDFNNMLSGISGAADILSERLRDDESISKFIRIIQDASGRASELTRKLLAFSRKANVTNAPIDLHEIIEETIGLLRSSIDKRISLELDLQATASVLVGDATQLQNALLNLALNARDAMPDGGTISISTENVPLDRLKLKRTDDLTGKAIVITVQDNGSGMTKDVQQHIFEPFYTTKGIGKGTGLGLAAVYGSIREHRGQIAVHSEVGGGTEFKLMLPTADIHVTQTKSSRRRRKKGQGLVLLVEDEEIVRTISATMLHKLGYEVVVAEDGKQAVDMFRENNERIHLILMDMVMPQMGGEEAFYRLREIRNEIPIILCSGFIQDQSVDKLLANGASYFLPKPFTIDELADALESALCCPIETISRNGRSGVSSLLPLNAIHPHPV